MSYKFLITDPLATARLAQPVYLDVPAQLDGFLWQARSQTGEKIICQRLDADSNHQKTRFVAIVNFHNACEIELLHPLDAENNQDITGIHLLPSREKDCFARLNTGCFDLELCHGTAQGTGASKWGLRHFRSMHDNFELLPSGNNAIGGFYGPFFTPENGLINPPEHSIVTIETIEKGPLLHHYRMHGTIPDGLLPELRGKTFSIAWKFFHATPWFERCYHVDDFQTVINGRSVTNKITVGDEFEGGQGALVFDRFSCAAATCYRAGDPYAGELVKMVAETIENSESSSTKFDEFRQELKNIETAHWDIYWRLFCAWEKVLPEEELRVRLKRVCQSSHILADLPARPWQITTQPINVSATPEATIFAGSASKTVEFHEETGRTMVWWTSQPSGAFQIVQRPQSGWVNWGTNGENECPELPVGVTIRTAYGAFAKCWLDIANQMECSPTASLID